MVNKKVEELKAEEAEGFSDGERLIIEGYPDAVYERKDVNKKTGEVKVTKCVRHFGLVGAAHKWHGGVKDWSTHLSQVASKENGNKAVCNCIITFKDGDTWEAWGMADLGNTTTFVQKHLDTMAETRSEVRCLRKALNVTKFVGEEELDSFQEDDDLESFAQEAEKSFRDITPKADAQLPNGWSAPEDKDRREMFDLIMSLPEGEDLMKAILSHYKCSSPEYLKKDYYTSSLQKILDQKKKIKEPQLT